MSTDKCCSLYEKLIRLKKLEELRFLSACLRIASRETENWLHLKGTFSIAKQTMHLRNCFWSQLKEAAL